MHQQQRRISAKYDNYENLVRQRLLSCAQKTNVLSNVPQRMLHKGLDEVTPNRALVRPHSSLLGTSGRQKPQTSKPILRAKSAQYPRLVKSTTPVQTNASDLQLRVSTGAALVCLYFPILLIIFLPFVVKADTHEGACSRNTLSQQICSWSLLPHI